MSISVTYDRIPCLPFRLLAHTKVLLLATKLTSERVLVVRRMCVSLFFLEVVTFVAITKDHAFVYWVQA